VPAKSSTADAAWAELTLLLRSAFADQWSIHIFPAVGGVTAVQLALFH
jgi:hypothetical protein